MRVRIWNASASNNSGSYSIVGSFPSADVAEQIAAELVPVIRAHTEWMEADDGLRWSLPGAVGSPLGRWAVNNGLRWDGDDGEDWPEYSSHDSPEVVAIGNQVLVHDDYTVSLPRAFGEFFFRRGGRVDIELNHAHSPLVVVLTCWVRWDDPQREERELGMPAFLASLDRELRPLVRDGTDVMIHDMSYGGAIRSINDGFYKVAAVFEDLVAGVAVARDLARSAGVSIGLQLAESPSETGDPLSYLRTAWAQDSAS